MQPERCELKERLELLLKSIDSVKVTYDEILFKLHQPILTTATATNMDFKGINKVGKMSEFLPVKKIMELEVQSTHRISDIRAVQTKFGKRYVADVSKDFTVFLPTRLANAFDENPSTFEEMVTAAHNDQLDMKYHGGKYNSIEFMANSLQ